MRKSLEERLAVVEEQKKATEKGMLDKQEIGQAALVEQELIMDKVVQESRLLQQEADENAKVESWKYILHTLFRYFSTLFKGNTMKNSCKTRTNNNNSHSAKLVFFFSY